MRNMSFAQTIPQMRDRSKTVTRRKGWGFLLPGDVVMAVEKAMGLKQGEKVKRIHPIRILDVRQEPLSRVTQDDVPKEGFTFFSREIFLRFMRVKYGVLPTDIITRIEFEHLED